VNGPRFHIAWGMALIAIAALDLAAVRTLSDSWGRTSGFLALGVLPMANILALALLLGLRPRGRRRFLLGFELFGGTALIVYAAVILSSTDLLWIYFVPAVRALHATFGPFATAPKLLIYDLCLGIWATWPQLTFALIGGFLAASRP
jgi:hypothetical protein